MYACGKVAEQRAGVRVDVLARRGPTGFACGDPLEDLDRPSSRPTSASASAHQKEQMVKALVVSPKSSGSRNAA